MIEDIKTSEGVDKFIGNLRLCYVGPNGVADEKRSPEGERAIILYDAADGQKLYQAISFEGVDSTTCNLFWAKLTNILWSIEQKRKRFYDADGNWVKVPTT